MPSSLQWMTKGATMRDILAITLAALLSAGSAGAQDWNAGVEAHDRGDFKRALAIWNIAARNGDLRAHYSIAMLYATGKGVPENELLAHGWWHDAATLGHAASQIAVGRNYLHGDVVSKDRKVALYWMRQAASQGDPYGQFVLAQTYSDDDAFSAYVWGNIGCANGQAEACVIRNMVKSSLSETELRSAQDAATTCFNSGYKSCD
jgi:TPR repeat protein